MLHQHHIIILIPAINEEQSIGEVLRHIPSLPRKTVIVADNGSTDRTAETARHHGALVVYEPHRGYGSACLAAMALAAKYSPDIIVFLDADFSDAPEEMTLLLEPIIAGKADFVIGSRVLGAKADKTNPGALLPQARIGNWIATTCIRLIWGYRFTDLGPFRAIRWNTLQQMKMADRTFGWTVEMQIKAAILNIPYEEIAVSYRKRIGTSKITGTVWGSVKAGSKILWTIARFALQ